VFLDPKLRAMSARGSSAPPIRRVSFLDNHVPRNVDQHPSKDQSKTCRREHPGESYKEAHGSLMGDLPAPSGEVQGVEAGESEDGTDEICFTAPEPLDKIEAGTEREGRAARTGVKETNSEHTCVYLPGDALQSPMRGVPEAACTPQSSGGTDIFSRSPMAAWMIRAVQMAGAIIREVYSCWQHSPGPQRARQMGGMHMGNLAGIGIPHRGKYPPWRMFSMVYSLLTLCSQLYASRQTGGCTPI
jgi:hypothetical protein